MRALCSQAKLQGLATRLLPRVASKFWVAWVQLVRDPLVQLPQRLRVMRLCRVIDRTGLAGQLEGPELVRASLGGLLPPPPEP